MAVRLIGTDSEDPRLPDVVIEASVGTTADDLASGEVYAYADSLYNTLVQRIEELENGAYVPPSSGNLFPEQANHAHTASEPVLFVSPFVEPADSMHAHTATSPTLLPDGPVEFTIQAGATTFSPWIQLHPGSTAVVEWRTSANTLITTGLTPTIARPANGIVRMYVIDDDLPAMNEVDYLNLGFNSSQDAGRDNIGSSYNHPGQPVTDLAGIQFLTGMRYFMAANTPLRSALDMTGMTNLEHIECFHARIPTLVMTGCTSLIRLCTEGCSIATVDLSTIRTTLHDLRCAMNSDTPGVDFIVDGPMTNLYHYCVQGQLVTQHIPNAYLPVVEEYWVYGTGIVDMADDPPTSPLLQSCLMYGNPINSATADAFINAVSDVTTSDFGDLNMQHSEAPTAASNAARAELEGRGWAVTCPASELTGVDGSDGTWTPPTHGPFVLANITSFDANPSVSAGVLTIQNGGYCRAIFRPGGRNAGDAFFEVEVDQSEISPTDTSGATNWWALFLNCNSAANSGLRVMIQWPSTNSVNANGVEFGPSDNANGSSGTVTRVASNPAGWGSAGWHKVGLYQAGNCAYVTFDGVKVYKCQSYGIDILDQGGYVGVGGSTAGTLRLFRTWGLATVTLP